jgi:hypothetical protein
MDARTNHLLAGRYSLAAPLGRGRSTVFRAVDTRLQRQVAVKQVELLAGQEDVERVRTRALREAQAAARLNNPCVVTVYDVAEEDGSIWLVMELVEAPSLAQLVVDEGPLAHQRAARIGLDVLTALEAAHVVGVVHRDVKPANVLVQPGDRGKLTDFGVATIRDDSRVTATGLIVGSPSYMSPEQATGAEVGPPTDLWSLGALLYFAVEGQPPFQAGSALATASAVVHGEPRRVERPGDLSDVILRLLTKDPAGRPSAGEVRVVLARVARGEGRRGLRRRAATDTTAVMPTAPAVPAPDPTPAPEPGPEVVAATAPAPPEPEPDVAPPTEPDPPGPEAEVPAPPEPEAILPTEPAPPERSPARDPAPVSAAAPEPAPAPEPATVSTAASEPEATPAPDPAPVPTVAPEPAPAPVAAPPPGPGRPATVVGGDGIPRRTYQAPEGPRSRLAILVAVAAAVLLAVVAVSVLRGGDDPGDTASDDPGTSATTTSPTTAGSTTAPTTATTAAPPTSAAPAGLPAGWAPYADPAGTYTIGVPPGWEVTRVADNRYDFRDPATGSFVRVEWTGTPGADPAGTWREDAVSFRGSHPGYEEIGIAPVAYRDYDAALWEFRHLSGGRMLHTGNLGFVTNGRGYALMLRTPEEQWAASQPVFEQFKQAFQPT